MNKELRKLYMRAKRAHDLHDNDEINIHHESVTSSAGFSLIPNKIPKLSSNENHDHPENDQECNNNLDHLASLSPSHSLALNLSENESSEQSCDETNSSFVSANDIILETINLSVTDLESQEKKLDFKDGLRNWAIQYNIPHNALSDLLVLLKNTVSNDLPLDARTLLRTPSQISLKIVEPGHYYHFGIQNAIENLIKSCNKSILRDHTIYLNINIDGLPLSKSSTSQVYPILCSISGSNIVDMIGVYHGYEKPKDANLFLHDFVTDCTNVINNGIVFENCFYNVKIKSLICDAPAKSYVKYVKGHTGYFSCTKCFIEGSYINNRICFPTFRDLKLRTDGDFRLKVQEEHHTGVSALENIPNFDMIISVPLDYMHLVCLGVVKKLLLLWCFGCPNTKISFRDITSISTSLIKLSNCIPTEFNRKPRFLNEVKRWKATEFRQFLLYTGPIVLKGVLSKDRYLNFLCLHVAIVILSSREHFTHINYASELLQYFVKTFKTLYGPEHMSHNIHNLLHLSEDVKHHGPLDLFSAFKFENYLQSILKSIRKHDKPLQQIIKRHAERINVDVRKEQLSEKVNYPIFRDEHSDGYLIENLVVKNQFKTILFKNFTVKIDSPNNYCGLSDGSIVKIYNILKLDDNKFRILGRKYLHLDNFYVIPMESSVLNIYQSTIESLGSLSLFDSDNITCKFVKLDQKSDSIFIPLLHTSS